jgi:two-component system, chemotaxis family, protein-glutamate methylesterase/glutaminase
MGANGTVRIVICEDSPTYSAALTRFLECDPDLKVVAIYPGCEELMRGLPTARADLVTMDIELPGLDGLYGTRWIMGWRPMPIVVLSAHAGPGSAPVAAALAAGALDAIDKSAIRLENSSAPSAVALRRRIKHLAHTRAAPTAASTGGAPHAAHETGARLATVVAIAASTGGPAALLNVLAKLPAEFPLPVLIVQHISAGFAVGLAVWLDSVVPLPVRLAVHGQRPTGGVWVAPDGAHLRLRPGGVLSLDSSGDANGHRPSGDVLLSSVAETARCGAVSVVLTGMGRDGGEGTAAVRAAGGLTIAQDEASSVVYGMPRAAAERGAALVLPVSAIGDALRGLRTAAKAR